MIKNLLLIVFVAYLFHGCSVKEQQTTSINNQQTAKQDGPSDKRVGQTQKGAKSKDIQDKSLEESLEAVINKDNYIAVVYPSSEINRYALEATRTINGYLLHTHRDKQYHIQNFDILTQSQRNIQKVFNDINEQGITKVILMITKEYLNTLKNIQGVEKLTIVLPLINKNEVVVDQGIENLNLLFTAISYKKQFEKLFEYARRYSLVDFYDNSSIGSTLHTFASSHPLKYSKVIDDNNGRYKRLVQRLSNTLQGSALILNTPIVKSSMLLSALSAKEVKPSIVLSTQLNFTPLVFSLTQRLDRNNLIIASSIGELPPSLEGYSELLGNNVLYNWVNYSCIIATEYLKSADVSIFEDVSIRNGQVIYPVKLYKVRSNSFALIPY